MPAAARCMHIWTNAHSLSHTHTRAHALSLTHTLHTRTRLVSHSHMFRQQPLGVSLLHTRTLSLSTHISSVVSCMLVHVQWYSVVFGTAA